MTDDKEERKTRPVYYVTWTTKKLLLMRQVIDFRVLRGSSTNMHKDGDPVTCMEVYS